jgi:hypothetical protein
MIVRADELPKLEAGQNRSEVRTKTGDTLVQDDANAGPRFQLVPFRINTMRRSVANVSSFVHICIEFFQIHHVVVVEDALAQPRSGSIYLRLSS